MKVAKIKNNIREKVSADVGGSLDHLIKLISPSSSFYNELINLKGTLNDIEKGFRNSTIVYDEKNRIVSRIRLGVLSVLDNMDENDILVKITEKNEIDVDKLITDYENLKSTHNFILRKYVELMLIAEIENVLRGIIHDLWYCINKFFNFDAIIDILLGDEISVEEGLRLKRRTEKLRQNCHNSIVDAYNYISEIKFNIENFVPTSLNDIDYIEKSLTCLRNKLEYEKKKVGEIQEVSWDVESGIPPNSDEVHDMLYSLTLFKEATEKEIKEYINLFQNKFANK